MTTQHHSVDVERLRAAIKTTEYKYFGDYEMSDDQRVAVDVLVECAEQRIAALTLPITQRDERGKLLGVLRQAEKALEHAGSELLSVWGADEGDDPVILDALAAIRRLSIEQGDQDGGAE